MVNNSCDLLFSGSFLSWSDFKIVANATLPLFNLCFTADDFECCISATSFNENPLISKSISASF